MTRRKAAGRGGRRNSSLFSGCTRTMESSASPITHRRATPIRSRPDRNRRATVIPLERRRRSMPSVAMDLVGKRWSSSPLVSIFEALQIFDFHGSAFSIPLVGVWGFFLGLSSKGQVITPREFRGFRHLLGQFSLSRWLGKQIIHRFYLISPPDRYLKFKFCGVSGFIWVCVFDFCIIE